MQNLKRLAVWCVAMDIADDVYVLSARFPRDERYGLTQQLRRSCLSIAANIAEGAGRGSDREFRRFLYIALGSLEETHTYLLFATRRGWIADQDQEPITEQLVVLRRRILTFIRKLGSELDGPVPARGS